MNSKNEKPAISEFNWFEYFPNEINEKEKVPIQMKRDFPYIVSDEGDQYIINSNSRWYGFTFRQIERRIADTTEQLQYLSDNWNKKYECITNWSCDEFMRIFSMGECYWRNDMQAVIAIAIIRDEISRRERAGSVIYLPEERVIRSKRRRRRVRRGFTEQ